MKMTTKEAMRSKESNCLSFVRFHNATHRTVEVIWLNYEGVSVKYKTLLPEQFFDVNTYVAHPWVFQDAQTHERLNANSKDVFEPGPWYEHYLPDLRSGRLQRLQDLQPKRVTVNITSPLYSLKESAINVILRCLPENSDRFSEAAYELEIPRQLQEELLLMREART